MTRHLHRLDPTTHTVELDQLHAIDAALARSDASAAITAASLGLPGEGRLVSISYDGPPEYPYVRGHFTGAGGDHVVEFHTEALQALAHALHLNQRWGL